MDNRKVPSNPNPRETANIFSILTWMWTIPLFKKGYRKVLGIEDLYDPVNKDRSNELGDRLEKQWLIEKQRAKRDKQSPSFLWTIFRTFTPEILLLGFIQIITELVFKLATPLLLGPLLQYFKPSSNASFETAIYYATAMVVANFFAFILLKQTVFYGINIGGRVRIAACSVVYRKALRLSKTALGETSPGKIVNLIANDVNRFGHVFAFLHYMWLAPLSAIIIMVLLYLEIGWPAFIGMGIIFLVVPLQIYLGKLSSKFRYQTSLKTDERVRLMDEIISGVQVIKMYAWEKPFCALVELARRLELDIVKKNTYTQGIYMTFFMITTRIALFGTLITMMLRGQELTAQSVFVYVAYFNLLSKTIGNPFIHGIIDIASCKVAINRIQYFLMFEEYQSNNFEININHSMKNDEEISNNLSHNNVMKTSNRIGNDLNKYKDTSKYENVMNHDSSAIKLNHVTAKWDLQSTEVTLDDIDLKVDKGKLYIVIGTVGAGKSSFLSMILGELSLLQGSTEVNGSISYADQDAWIFSTTIRQNILFGQGFDRQRYLKVIRVCALQKDFQDFPQGDQTIVGEHGNSLSGGQKARINLARAIYRQADIYLLDDPLSAVDARVGKHLFEECFQKHLSGKTRILATHQLQFIKKADAILLLDEGKLSQFDNYHELLYAYPEYNSLISEDKEKEAIEDIVQNIDSKRRFSSISIRSHNSEYGIKTDQDDDDDKKTEKDTFLESSSRGTVQGSLLANYVKCGANNIVLLLILVFFIATQVCASLTDSFIPVLVNAEESRTHYNQLHENASLIPTNNEAKLLKEEDILPRDYYMYIYTGLIAAIFLITITRYFAFYRMCFRASQRLHDLAFGALIRATMRFFDTNPSGRILNRFSKDLGAIDEILPRVMTEAGQSILTVLGAIIVTCTVNFWFLLPVLLIGALSYFVRATYLKTSKNIKRLEGMTKSPVFTHLNATLNGLATIRAYKAENILKKEFDNLQDTHTSSWFMFFATNSAFGFSLDLCCFLFTGVVTFTCLILKEHFTGGEVGLAITQVMSLTGLVQMSLRLSAEVTNQLMSVERVLEYSQLPSEPNIRDKGILGKIKKQKKEREEENLLIKPSEDWPAKGQVEFKDVSMRYSNEYVAVLRNLTLMIRPTEKIGIVGRTGAGKSSLISALFRLAKVEGIIEIDGIDTGNIALEDLRKQISIIPQDPVLFSGTLRRNLDPFNEFSDQQLYKVLEEVEFKDSMKSNDNGLDNRVQDRGSNYSTGQRQLICLARAILRNNRILMLDEATANVDPHTDALIQRTIRTKFASCTVLTVAHRLNTIMDSDRILMLDEGQVVEFDHPYLLLQKENGLFSSLVRETGHSMYDQLQTVAKSCYFSKHAGTQR